MSTISSVRIGGGHRRLLVSVVVGAALVVSLTAIVSLEGVDLAVALALVILFLAVLALLLAVRAEIRLNEKALIILLRPVMSRTIPLAQVRDVAPTSDTSGAEGFGYRNLGRNRRGLLVGGPSVEITTPEKSWVVSCENALRTAELLKDQSRKRRDP